MINDLQLWAIPSAEAVQVAIEQRDYREHAFLTVPRDNIEQYIYDWFPGSVKTNGKVARMSCKAPVFLGDYQRMQENLERLAGDGKIELLILEVNSPGGMVCGCKEAYEAFRDFEKASLAVCCGQATSASYWLSAGTDMIVATESSYIGSIGVIDTHVSIEELQKAQGIKVTEVVKGPKKNQFSSQKDLTNEAKAEMVAQVDAAYRKFVGCVKESRGKVDEKVFDSGVYSGNDAEKVGLIDKVENRLI